MYKYILHTQYSECSASVLLCMHSVWCTVYTVQSTLFTGIDNNYNNTRERVQQPVISQQHKIHNTTIDVRGNILKHYYYSEVQRAYICSVHLLFPSLFLST